MEVLVEMEKCEFQEIGITKFGDRHKLFKALEKQKKITNDNVEATESPAAEETNIEDEANDDETFEYPAPDDASIALEKQKKITNDADEATESPAAEETTIDDEANDDEVTVNESTGVVLDLVDMSDWQFSACQKCSKKFENEKDVFDHMARNHPVLVESPNVSSQFDLSMDGSVVYQGKLLSERTAEIIKILETLLYNTSNHEKAVELVKLKAMKPSENELKEYQLDKIIKEMSKTGGPHGSMANLCIFEWEKGVLKLKEEHNQESPRISTNSKIDESVFITPPPVTPENKYKCKHCENKFKSVLELVSHSKEHKEKKRKRKNDEFLDESTYKKSAPSSPCLALKKMQGSFTCDICSTRYARKDGLKRHTNKVH